MVNYQSQQFILNVIDTIYINTILHKRRCVKFLIFLFYFVPLHFIVTKPINININGY